MSEIIYDHPKIDFSRPGKHHYQLALHQDSSWGYSLVPLTVINGLRKSAPQARTHGVVAFGGTHGNEWEGQVAVKRLCLDLNPEEISGRVILIPQLSESACVANARVSPLDGVNMNRAFPGNPRGTISYRISNFVKTRIFPQVSVVLDIHAGAGFPLLSSFHPIPEPVQRAEIARVAQLFDTPFVYVYSSEMASGLLTDEAEAEGKVTVGGEFGFHDSVELKGTLHAYEGIKNVLRYYGMLPGEIVKIDPSRPTPPRFVAAPKLHDYIPCPKDGVWEALVEVGTNVQQADLVGRLHDFSDHALPALEVRAHRSGVFLYTHFSAVVSRATTLYVIAEEAQF